MCGRYDREYSPSDADVYCSQYVEVSERNEELHAQRYHACRVISTEGTNRIESICGLLRRNRDEVDDAVVFDSAEAAEEYGLPRCALCAESGVFGDSSE